MKCLFAMFAAAAVALTCAAAPSALETLKTKAKAGDVKAQMALAEKYAEGSGVTKSATEAANWYRTEAERERSPSRRTPGLPPDCN